MILVGLVAVLGVSLPSRSESGGWLSSAHNWVIAQLAEWDTYTPGEDRCVVLEAPEPLPRGATRAAGRTNIPSPVTFRPIPIADDRDNRLADELNRLSEGLDGPATNAAIAESPADFVAVSSSDPIELKLALELCRIVEASAHDETVSSPAVSQPRQAEADPTIDEIFADGLNVFATPVQGPAVPVGPEPTSPAARTTFELIRPLVDFESDTAAALNRFAEGIEIVAEDAPPQPARIQAFEPIKVPADLESGIAYELNRASEGLESVLPEVGGFAKARPPIPASGPAAPAEGDRNPGDASIGKALDLTRDAALAWMNVLTGMTPVVTTSQ
jgi:hypothetical protein